MTKDFFKENFFNKLLLVAIEVLVPTLENCTAKKEIVSVAVKSNKGK